MADAACLRTTMISGQLLPNKVTDGRVIQALKAVPREHFVPKALRSLAYIDEDIEVAPGRYLLEPMVFARLVEEAKIASGDLVLDLNCASGYSTAVLAQLAGTVLAVEPDEDLARLASENLLALEIGNAAVVAGQPQEGYAKEAPYDVIMLNGAIDYLPPALVAQVKDGGRIAGVRMDKGVGRGFIATKVRGTLGVVDFMDANVPILAGFTQPKGFQF
ncbi:MAG: protein-L-isoaspartate O-methyltransferase family protein [Pseudomonadota bacterium]